MLIRRDQAGNVGHVHHELGPDLVGYLPEPREVYCTGVGRCAGYDDLGSVLLGQALHLVVVNQLHLPVDAVGHEVVNLGGEADGGSVGQVAAVVQAHAHGCVAGTHGGEVRGHIGLGAAVGLNVCVLGPEELFGPVNGEALGHVHELAAAVVTPPRVTLCIFVGHNAALGFQDGPASVVLRCNKIDRGALAVNFVLNGPPYLRVLVHQRAHVPTPCRCHRLSSHLFGATPGIRT